MTTIVLGIGDFAVRAGPVEYVCHGLGSCMAVFLYDKTSSITAGAHIPVPSARGGSPIVGADIIFNQMSKQLTDAGCTMRSLEAKITGGAKINRGHTMTVGEQNIYAVYQQLQALGIPIASIDVGGHNPRTARFSSSTATIQISIPEKGNYQI